MRPPLRGTTTSSPLARHPAREDLVAGALLNIPGDARYGHVEQIELAGESFRWFANAEERTGMMVWWPVYNRSRHLLMLMPEHVLLGLGRVVEDGTPDA